MKFNNLYLLLGVVLTVFLVQKHSVCSPPTLCSSVAIKSFTMPTSGPFKDSTILTPGEYYYLGISGTMAFHKPPCGVYDAYFKYYNIIPLYCNVFYCNYDQYPSPFSYNPSHNYNSTCFKAENGKPLIISFGDDPYWDNCGSLSFTVYKIVNPPNVNLGPDRTICPDSSVTLSAGNPGCNYLWNTGATSQSISVTSPGEYWVEVIDNNCSCVKSTDTIVVLASIPVVPTISGANMVCANDSCVIYTTQSDKSGYVWQLSSGLDLCQGSTLNESMLQVKWNATGVDTLKVTYIDSSNCPTSFAGVLVIHVLPPPVPIITGDTIACQGSTGFLYTTVGGMQQYSWQVLNGSIGMWGGTNDSSVIINWGLADTGTIIMNYVDLNGCSASDSSVLEVLLNQGPAPNPQIIGQNYCCQNNSYNYSTNYYPINSYEWKVNSGQIISGQDTSSVTILWDSGGLHLLTVKETSGTCISYGHLLVDVKPSPNDLLIKHY